MNEEITIIAIGLRKIEMKLRRFTDGSSALLALDAEQQPRSSQSKSTIVGVDGNNRPLRASDVWRKYYSSDDPTRRKRK